MLHLHRPLSLAGLTLLLLTGGASAPALAKDRVPAALRVTSPLQFFGHEIGADYELPNYQKLTAYWQKLDRESDRMQVVEIGKTAEGRPQWMSIITSPSNARRLGRYREIARRLALAEGVSESEARDLAREGKAVVWIDGGLHANETLGAQQLMESVYQLVSKNDPETLRILDDCVILAVHANPDGMDLVSDWYMREADPQRRSLAGLPRLYQKYIGHDNNRDFYAVTQAESKNMSRVMYREWYPQIAYNHHQTGPAGTVMYAPPFRDPFNYNYDPLVVTQLDLVGAAMHSRFVAEGKPGVTMRSGAPYSTWWNGGLRTTVYFHNMIGLLTETIGSPTPTRIPLLPDRQLPKADLPAPIAPQLWRFRQSIDYSVTANYAVLDVASRYRETFLYNIYRMGRNSIERGSRDSWTITPQRIDALKAAMAKDGRDGPAPAGGDAGDSGAPRPAPGAENDRYLAMLREPARRDPRGYILPSDQPDFLTATKFVRALAETGITIHQAERPFTVAGKSYPAGSYVIKTAQAFRPHILDMFEPQDHPNDFRFPGAPPTPPYDSAGWTLAYQMGVQFDRILEGFEGPFRALKDLPATPQWAIIEAPRGGGYLLDRRVNDAFRGVNRLLKDGATVQQLTATLTSGGKEWPAGTFYIPAASGTSERLARLATEVGLNFQPVAEQPAASSALRPKRVALWDRYGGSMPSGWTRFILEQFEFPFTVVYPPDLDRGNLREKYDVILFVDGGIPARDTRGGTAAPRNLPEEYRGRIGQVTVSQTVPQLKRFMEEGGTVLTIGSSTVLATHLGLPVTSALVEPGPDGRDRPLSREKYYVPGSVLRSRLQTGHPLTAGLPDAVDVFFNASPAFRLSPDAEAKGVRRLGWYDSETPLLSGWAWGQRYLKDAASVVEAKVGKGRLVLYGPEVAFRAQPHGTFKLLFNGIYLADAEGAKSP